MVFDLPSYFQLLFKVSAFMFEQIVTLVLSFSNHEIPQRLDFVILVEPVYKSKVPRYSLIDVIEIAVIAEKLVLEAE